MGGERRVACVVGALVAALLQIMLAPYIAIFSATPNFLLAYVLVVAVVRFRTCGYVLPFVLGLAFDLIGNGPVGAMALLFVLATLAVSRLYFALDNDTQFFPVVLIVAAVFAVEILYGVLVVACGVSVGLLQAFAFVSLPCALYDCVFALVMYPLARVFLVSHDDMQPSIPLVR